MASQALIFAAIFWYSGICCAQTPTPSASTSSSSDSTCYAGAYRNEQGDILTLSAEPDKSGWRFFLMDGRTGLLKRANGDKYAAGPGWSEEKPAVAKAKLGSCNPSSVDFALEDGPNGTGHRIQLRVADTHFEAKGAQLAGRLVEPVERGPWPLVVIVHGSEQYSAVNYYSLPWMMAAQGIAVFVYDKRGTGNSTGTFTMNFDVLADDAAAALRTVRRLAGKKISRAGFFGGSQGGWIAPLAATRAKADFLEISFGLAGSPLDQDAWGVEYELRYRGYGAEILENAHELTEITRKIAASNFTDGFEQLDEFVARHKGEAWLQKIEGQYTGALLHGQVESLQCGNPGVIWRYDAMRVLRELDHSSIVVLGRGRFSGAEWAYDFKIARTTA
jgi:uncharacterized protein